MPTLATIRGRVAIKINDADAKHASFDPLRLDHAIADAHIALSAMIPPPHLYVTNAFTMAANSDTFTLPTAANAGYVSFTQYAGEVKIRLVSDGRWLRKVSRSEIDALYDGVTQTTGAGRPRRFALWQEMDDDVQGRVHPRCGPAETCDLYVALTADDIRDAADLDAANVRFGRYGSTALVYHAAALLVGEMDDESLKLRRLNSGVVNLWIQQAQSLLQHESFRKTAVESRGPGRFVT